MVEFELNEGGREIPVVAVFSLESPALADVTPPLVSPPNPANGLEEGIDEVAGDGALLTSPPNPANGFEDGTAEGIEIDAGALEAPGGAPDLLTLTTLRVAIISLLALVKTPASSPSPSLIASTSSLRI